MTTFYDVHFHANDLSHSNILAFLERRGIHLAFILLALLMSAILTVIYPWELSLISVAHSDELPQPPGGACWVQLQRIDGNLHITGKTLMGELKGVNSCSVIQDKPVQLFVDGPRIRLQSGSSVIDLRADGAATDLESPSKSIAISGRGQGKCPWDCNNVYLNPWGGNVGIGTITPQAKLDVQGDPHGYAALFKGNVIIKSPSTNATIIELGEGLDYAEGFDVSEKSVIAPGTVLVIDPKNPGKLAVSDVPYDHKVAGIVTGAKGQGSGISLATGQFDYKLALAGRVYCNVDATYGEVLPGDLLTTSPTQGYAMMAKDKNRAQGAILGKAMEHLPSGKKGQILVLVTLQ